MMLRSAEGIGIRRPSIMIADELRERVKAAAPGTMIVYHARYLPHDRVWFPHEQDTEVGNNAAAVGEVSRAPMRLCADEKVGGIVDLLQRRLGELLYEYIAIKRSAVLERKRAA
jgi:hypothetical protein